MRLEFAVADGADDSAIRVLLASNPMPGAVTVAFEREPDYFRGHGVMGNRCVTVKAVDAATGELAGIVCVAASNRFVNAAVSSVGYIGELRIDKKYRGLLIPLRAIRFVRDLVDSGWPDFWFSALAQENPNALAIFALRPRPSFPPLELVARIQTLGIYTRPVSTRSKSLHRPRKIEIRRGAEVGIESIVRFLSEQGPNREFFPAYTREDFVGQERTPGFNPDDFLVALCGSEPGSAPGSGQRLSRTQAQSACTAGIAGVCGVWDQSSFKQTVVHGYRGLLRRARPAINTFGRVFGVKPLPARGEQLKSAYLSVVAVRGDDPHVWRALLSEAIGVAHAQGKDYLLAGFTDQDPLLAMARRYRHILYRSTMYAYTFNGTVPPGAFDRSRIPYVEIAAL